ncbi:DUF4240 domain-containing protein [Streptomyces mirabilis]|uniref:DUF4240 domain-containing protein n=1 Tax=Streptomyces mirabilis TaxID=68239 RepID=UPI000765E2B0|nr:DUF4240 domain-containing protein [Streptomyces mirabilis]
MNIDEFWTVIETARTDAASASGDPGQAFASALVERLAATSKQTILEYQQCFDQLHGAIYRWDVWAAGYLIGGGCSDDAFMDFRAGLIAQGREWYERAVTAPDDLAQHPDLIAAAAEGSDEAIFNETVNYAASYAYERINGDEDDCTFYDECDQFCGPRADHEPADMGESFDFDDASEMQARLPELARLLLEHSEA